MSEQNTSPNPNSADILKLFSQWRFEATSSLTTIVGYATFLLGAQNENLTEQQKRFLAIIRQAGLKSYSSWNSPSDYLKLMFDSENIHWKWEPVPLSETCQRISSATEFFINKSMVRVSVSDELPPVRADRDWLSRAIFDLLIPSVGYHYNESFESSISAQAINDNLIVIRIATGLELAMDPKTDNLESISTPGNSLNVASIILQRHGSRLEFRRLPSQPDQYLSQGTEFEFVLPIWR